jgi:hypothetical protein
LCKQCREGFQRAFAKLGWDKVLPVTEP